MVVQEKEAEVYDFIVNYVEEHLYAPTVREIGNGVGLNSTSSVSYLLERLQLKGLIEYKYREPRTIKLIGFKLIENKERP